MVPPLWKRLTLACALVAAVLLTGCASVKQYSIDTYQGPMPLGDTEYMLRADR